jgi:hypothetical protein
LDIFQVCTRRTTELFPWMVRHELC